MFQQKNCETFGDIQGVHIIADDIIIERLVLAYMKDTTGPLLEPLQFAYRENRSVDDAVNMGLPFILQQLDRPGTYVRILFVDFSSAFNTIIPN